MITAVDCGTLETPTNGYQKTDSTTVGSVADFGCDEGFHSHAWNLWRVCLKTGKWTGEDVTCREFYNIYADTKTSSASKIMHKYFVLF